MVGAGRAELAARIHQLVTDLPAIWNDPAAPARERKGIARLLPTDVTVIRTTHTITAHIPRSREQRLRDAGMLTLAETAALLSVRTGTVTAWHHAGLITVQST